MLKRLLLVLATIAGLASPAYSAGLVPLSLQTVIDNTGNPATGCKLYTYTAATTTPQTVYQDSGLSIAWPFPTECDAVARLPQMFAADGNIKLRLTTSTGVELLAIDSVLVIGPSSGGGGGGSVDATTILQTGDIKTSYRTGAHTGFVRCNGRTIGSATSGATERANSDTQALFEYFWNTDANLTVSTGRGLSAAADWAANKTIAIPDWRGRLIAFLGDMGNTATTDLTSTYYGADPTVLGQPGGAQSSAIAQTNLPSVNFNLSVSITDPGHFHASANTTAYVGSAIGNLGLGGVQAPTTIVDLAGVSTGSKTTGITASGTAASGGSGTAFANVAPSRLATCYLKL